MLSTASERNEVETALSRAAAEGVREMRAELTLPTGLLYGFLLVLVRVAGALVFVPLPGLRGLLEPARAMLALGFTMALAARWPVIAGPAPGPSLLLAWIASEAALGLALGACVAVVLEVLAMAAQIMGLQAGYAYASTIDPNTEADSGVLLVFAQLMAGMLFFALGLDREVLRVFGESLDKIPPGAFSPGRPAAEAILELAGKLFVFGLRLALPVVGLLIMVDLALALLGRLNTQLQLLSLAFPVKMLIALLVLGWVTPLAPRLMTEFAAVAWRTMHRVVGG
jgi:flagellar biosynthetic protein FliR